MFDNFRQSLESLFHRSTTPEDRRALLAHMRDTLTRAKLGLEDLRQGVATTRARVAAEQRELDTVLRRKRLAEGIGDAETVQVAERFERQHQERVTVLTQKLAAQESELAMTEDDVREMTEAFKSASRGAMPGGMPAPGVSTAEPTIPGVDGPDPAEYDALRRTQERMSREADASRRLEELKRRMGK